MPRTKRIPRKVRIAPYSSPDSTRIAGTSTDNTSAPVHVEAVEPYSAPSRSVNELVRLHAARETETLDISGFPVAPFSRMVRDIARLLGNYRFQADTILALKEAAEHFLVSLFEDMRLCALHGRRVTIRSDDLQLAIQVRRDHVLRDMWTMQPALPNNEREGDDNGEDVPNSEQ